ncbi:MAG: 30S ribosomal protein S6 [Candidatus Staskawiczbacteria bacterium]|nr:30S ribosomal protein S6 [Candidatus Staskawiczbacteria bacterium]MBI3337154.1 30S ribosomal protein S6 [Candidatus Staskawiczbacteria bacterium]
MKPYELTYIISSEITAREAEEKAKSIESLIQDKNGIVLRSEKPSARTLAYNIKKQSSGFFGVLEFQLEPEYLGELNEKIQKDNKIIRHMVLINNPAKIQKERRIKKKPLISNEAGGIIGTIEKDLSPKTVKKTNKKVELEEIEKELDEILSE